MPYPDFSVFPKRSGISHPDGFPSQQLVWHGNGHNQIPTSRDRTNIHRHHHLHCARPSRNTTMASTHPNRLSSPVPAWNCRDGKTVIPIIRIGIWRRILTQVYDISCNRIFVGPSPPETVTCMVMVCGVKVWSSESRQSDCPLRIIYVIHAHRLSGHPKVTETGWSGSDWPPLTVTAVITSVFTRYS